MKKVKELLKSFGLYQSYRKTKSGTFFMAHGVYDKMLVITTIIVFIAVASSEM